MSAIYKLRNNTSYPLLSNVNVSRLYILSINHLLSAHKGTYYISRTTLAAQYLSSTPTHSRMIWNPADVCCLPFVVYIQYMCLFLIPACLNIIVVCLCLLILCLFRCTVCLNVVFCALAVSTLRATGNLSQISGQ